MVERVVLVDGNDAEIGTMEKQAAHIQGSLHRALSVFVINGEGQMLLQRRAAAKYHSPGLWTNTCCSHPRPGEDVDAAARRRLREEMGFDCEMEPAFSFVYRADVGQGLTEHEFDHVFLGRWDGEPNPEPGEVDGWRWASPEAIEAEVRADPEAFTPWFRIVLARPEWARTVAGLPASASAG